MRPKCLPYCQGLFLLFLMVQSFSPLMGQGYFPLSIGNRWKYDIVVNGANTVTQINRIEKDTLMSNSLLYSVLRVDSTSNRYLRQSNKIVYEYFGGVEKPLFDFSKNDNDTLSNTGSAIVIVQKTIKNKFGRQLTHWSYATTYPNNPMPFYSVVEIADSLGIVLQIDHNELVKTVSCSGVIIDGKTYGDISGVNDVINYDGARSKTASNYPNPFNPTTTIRYFLDESEFATVKVFDILGREVAILMNRELPKGEFTVFFDAHNLASGCYFAVLMSKRQQQLVKLYLAK